MDAKVFVKLVAEMMSVQADYFKNRTQSSLIASKNLEKRVREALAEGITEQVIDPTPAPPQMSTFGEGEKQASLFE